MYTRRRGNGRADTEHTHTHTIKIEKLKGNIEESVLFAALFPMDDLRPMPGSKRMKKKAKYKIQWMHSTQ